jgi:hypothetical protein
LEEPEYFFGSNSFPELLNTSIFSPSFPSFFESSSSDEILSDEVLSDEVLSDEVLSDEVLSDEVLSDEVLSDEVLSDEVLSSSSFETLSEELSRLLLEGAFLEESSSASS